MRDADTTNRLSVERYEQIRSFQTEMKPTPSILLPINEIAGDPADARLENSDSRSPRRRPRRAPSRAGCAAAAATAATPAPCRRRSRAAPRAVPIVGSAARVRRRASAPGR